MDMGMVWKGSGARRAASLLAALALTAGIGAAEGGVRLIPGGQLLGVAVASRGLIYVGASDLGSRPSPARLAGLQNGDVIETVNGESVDGAASFAERVAGGGRVRLGVTRGGKPMTLTVSPERDPRDGSFRIGAWVRDSTAGVGTLTFIDPKTGRYGALGHAIADPDTQTTVPVREGSIYESDAAGVIPGRQGSPGELAGDFVARNRRIGTIDWNTEAGIGGTYIAANVGSALFPDGLEAGSAADVTPGGAQIIATVDERGPQLYDIEILSANGGADTRNLSLKIADERLLAITGGIVQGMSGAPIVQDGKLVGAVTHVLVNDPARGYGISLDRMLKNLEEARGNAA